jgi:hypothetical protein
MPVDDKVKLAILDLWPGGLSTIENTDQESCLGSHLVLWADDRLCKSVVQMITVEAVSNCNGQG